MLEARISRLLNHMTLVDLNNYALLNNAEIEINDGVAEEILLDIQYSTIESMEVVTNANKQRIGI